jgi:hypothetical protein
MGNSAAQLFGPLLCGLHLQGLDFSIVVARSSCYQRADNQDWQQTQDDRPNDEGREGKEIRILLLDDEDGKKYAQLPREILNSEKTKAAIARGNLHCDRRTTFGKKLGKMIETAEKHEADREAAIERSGLRDAMARQWEAAWEIEKLAYEARDIEPQTMAGVLIQARVLSAYAEVEVVVGHYRGRSGQLVGLALAQSLTRLSVA